MSDLEVLQAVSDLNVIPLLEDQRISENNEMVTKVKKSTLGVVEGKAKNRAGDAVWKKRLEAWQKSGLSIPAYAKQTGLDRTLLYQWRKHLGLAPDKNKIEQARKAEWVKRVSTWQKSGEGVLAYCRRERIDPSNFGKWRKRLETEGAVEERSRVSQKRSKQSLAKKTQKQRSKPLSAERNKQEDLKNVRTESVVVYLKNGNRVEIPLLVGGDRLQGLLRALSVM